VDSGRQSVIPHLTKARMPHTLAPRSVAWRAWQAGLPSCCEFRAPPAGPRSTGWPGICERAGTGWTQCPLLGDLRGAVPSRDPTKVCRWGRCRTPGTNLSWDTQLPRGSRPLPCLEPQRQKTQVMIPRPLALLLLVLLLVIKLPMHEPCLSFSSGRSMIEKSASNSHRNLLFWLRRALVSRRVQCAKPFST
jgi:hypothetical protein